MTEEEIRILIDEGTRAGVIEEEEQDLVENVFRLGDRRAASLMIPRADIVWLDVNDPADEIRKKVENSDYPLYPVARGSLDQILGFVMPKDMLSCSLKDQKLDLISSLLPAKFIPESMPALKILELFKRSGVHVALVIDEYGSIQGLVTLKDILEDIVGDLPHIDEPIEPQIVQREDGSWLIDGMLPIDEFKETFHIKNLPEEDSGYYQTIGGLVMMYLGKIPSVGDHFDWGGMRFEVMDMDENRVDKLLLIPAKKENLKEEAKKGSIL